MKVEPWISRRAAIVLAEALSPDARYDQTMKYALRVISNFVTVSQNGDSNLIKRLNPRMSAAALALRNELPLAAWFKATKNEHPEPLSTVWAWAVTNAALVTPQDLIAYMAKHPMVTVTNEEDARLSKRGFRSKGLPQERYLACEIDADVSPCS